SSDVCSSDLAGTRRDRAVSQIGLHVHVWAAEIFSHERQIVFGHGEVGINRIEALNSDERRSRGSNEVANVKIAQTYSSFDGRFDVAIIQVHLSSLRRRLRLLCVRYGNIVVLLRYDLSCDQILLSLQRHLI